MSADLVLAPGQEELAGRLFAVDPRRAHGYRLLQVQIQRTFIQAHYINLLDRSRVTLELRRTGAGPVDPPDGAIPAGDTGLQIRITGSLPTRTSRALAAHIARSAARAPLRWISTDDMAALLNVELCAVLAGVKPAARSALPPNPSAGLEAEVSRHGLAMSRLERPVAMDGSEWSLVYVAKTAEIAERVCDIERRQRAAKGEEELRLQRELGLALGYPSCCVDVFCGRHVRVIDDQTRLGAGAPDPAYLMARDAYSERAEARLNPFLFGELAQLISFDPCRFDCGEALRLADVIAAAVGRESAAYLEEIDRALAVPVAVHPSGARAVVTLESVVTLDQGDGVRIAGARPVRRVHGEEPAAAEERIAGELVGRRVGVDGLVEGTCEPKVVVIDFGPRGGGGR